MRRREDYFYLYIVFFAALCYNSYMITGISTRCLNHLAETEECLSLIGRSSAEVCDVYLRTFYEYRPEFAEKYAQNLSGVKAYSVRVNPDNFERQLFSRSRRVRGDGFYWLDQLLRSVQIFGAENYSFGLKRDEVENWDGYIGEIRAFCARYGVNLCTLEDDAEKSPLPYTVYLNGSTGVRAHAYTDGCDGGFALAIKSLKASGFDGTVILNAALADIAAAESFFKAVKKQ